MCAFVTVLRAHRAPHMHILILLDDFVVCAVVELYESLFSELVVGAIMHTNFALFWDIFCAPGKSI